MRVKQSDERVFGREVPKSAKEKRLFKTKYKKSVLVHRKGKTFYRSQWVKKK